jgi:antitoxin ParD1/3/4
MATKKPRSTEGFSTLDDFLGEEGIREAFHEVVAVKEVEEAEKLNCFRKAWQEGLDSGDSGEIDFAVLKKEARARLAASKV